MSVTVLLIIPSDPAGFYLVFSSTPEIKIDTLLMCEVLKWSVEVKPICIKAINGLLVKMCNYKFNKSENEALRQL